MDGTVDLVCADERLPLHHINKRNIPDFYAGKNVFITGGSGFIGKVLIEKLLRSCPDISRIYMMLRPKKGKTVEERINSLFNIPLFEKLLSEQPDALAKVVAIQGDICEERLGISDEQRAELCENINIVIHSAATIRFDEPLRVALKMNVFAVREINRLCHEIKNLEVFCHISTAYSQCNLPASERIEERFYEMDTDPSKIVDLLSWMSDDMLAKITPQLLSGYPNTYSFTKAIAELQLRDEASDLPLVIVRPSIVCPSIMEPVPGWIDNYNGISGMIVAAGKGVFRTWYCNPEVSHDIVPVDLVSRCIISSIWYRATISPQKEVLLCNCTSSNANPQRFTTLGVVVAKSFEKYPYNSMLRRPNFSFAGSNLINRYWMTISHYLPAIVADGLGMMVGKWPKFLRAYNTLHSSMDIFNFFLNNEWKWKNDQFDLILKSMGEGDREEFNFDMKMINWKDYYDTLALGVKLYVVKEKICDLPEAFRLKQRYKMVRWLSTTIMTLIMCRVFFMKSERFRKCWFEVMFAAYRFLRYLNMANVNA